MKRLLLILLLTVAPTLRAASTSNGYYTPQTFTVGGTAYDVSFSITWWADDYPMNSAPGRIELFDSGGSLVGRVVASNYQGSGPSISVSGSGTVDGVASNVGRYAGGAPADGFLSATWHITGLNPGTYTLRLWHYTTWDTNYSATTVWTDAEVISAGEPAPVNQPPAVTLLAPGSQTVTAGTTLTITAQATDPDGNLSAHNLDIQRPAGDWNFQGGFATGEPYQGGPVGSGADSTRSAGFTFSDVGTYYVRSGANDGSGWYYSATVTIQAIAPPPVQYSLATSAGSGGTVSPGGTFNAGTSVTLVATPDAYHDFAGWSGNAGGTVNPVGVLMDGHKAVQANFSWKQFALTTSATSGGSVTPGGSYPYGSIVTLAAMPDSTSRFTGWTGGASGTATTTVVTINGPLTVQAMFAPKNGQSLTFANPGNRPSGSPPFALDGTSSAGLPVLFTVVSGPATYSAGQLQITGPGPITVQASQPGDAFFLPAPAVTQTFNSVSPVVIKYRNAARTVLQARSPDAPANLVLENP